jgi:hypothetical protein
MQTKRIVTSRSIERRSSSGIQRGQEDYTNVYDARAWFQGAGYDRCDHVCSAEVLDHKPWRPSFAIVVEISQSLWGTGLVLVAFSHTSSNFMRSIGIDGCPHDGSSEWP